MKQKSALINLVIVFTLLFGVGFKCNDAPNGGGDVSGGNKKIGNLPVKPNDSGKETTSGGPTKSEIKETLTKRAESIYLTETQRTYYKIENVELDFDDSSIRVGSPVEKQVEIGVSGKSVYPVKANYTMITTYSDGREPKTERLGDGIVEYFYRDSFGKWKARYGSDT